MQIVQRLGSQKVLCFSLYQLAISNACHYAFFISFHKFFKYYENCY